MQFKPPRNTRYLKWTKYVAKKMMFYGLSAGKIKSVLSRYKRKEKGVAPNTIAVMQKSGTRKRPQEIWVMYQDKESFHGGIKETTRVIITAWRYPGISKPREQIPLPEGLLSELETEEGIELT